jgi:hypothetical protein
VLGAALAIALAAGPLHAQDSDDEWLDRCRSAESGSWSDTPRERFCEVRIVRLRPRGRLALDGRENGSVAVRGGGGGEAVVHARITAQAPTRGEAESIARELRVVSDEDSVYAVGPDRRGRRHWDVSYLVEVPRRADLLVVTGNGSVAASDVSGRIDLSAQNGSLMLAGLGGDVRARAENGSLSVRLTGERWDGRGLDAETENGSVRIEVPEGYGARLETGTVNGGFTTDFPLTVEGRVGRRISTEIGGGGPTVRATTTNGSVALRRR